MPYDVTMSLLNTSEFSEVSKIYALDFSSWKRSALCQCFPSVQVVFISNATDVPSGGVLVVWGMKPIPGELAADVKILRLEDGFLRSVGLGADLIRPMSWVVDSRGIYYDATRPSDLEHLLAERVFPPEMVARAALLRERIVAERLTKYNIGVSGWQRPSDVENVILVPGQVESDASLAYGAPNIRTNIGLLEAVRRANEKAYIVYKPHPDVMAGLRAKGKGEDEALRWCNELVTDVAMGDMLMAVDEVHVLTSLAGFEALLRGKSVTCYGLPFYSGWGLTEDVIPNPRRSRQLSIDELVAGALVEYPVYLSRISDALITPEQALDELLAWRARAGVTVPWWRKCFRIVLRLVMGVR
jgi:capsular polysaccharide export protein